MVNFRIIEFSHKLFSGFQRMIDLDEVESIQDIIDFMYIQLMEYLHMGNLELLIQNLKESKTKLHIHDFTFGTILLTSPPVIIYICDHG